MTETDLTALKDLAHHNLELIRVIFYCLLVLTIGFTVLAVSQLLSLKRQSRMEAHQKVIEDAVLRMERESAELMRVVKEYVEFGEKLKAESRAKLTSTIGEKVKESVREVAAELPVVPVIVSSAQTESGADLPVIRVGPEGAVVKPESG